MRVVAAVTRPHPSMEESDGGEHRHWRGYGGAEDLPLRRRSCG